MSDCGHSRCMVHNGCLRVAVKARADEVRAALRQAMATPCACDGCPTEDQMVALLDLDDVALLAAIA